MTRELELAIVGCAVANWPLLADVMAELDASDFSADGQAVLTAIADLAAEGRKCDPILVANKTGLHNYVLATVDNLGRAGALDEYIADAVAQKRRDAALRIVTDIQRSLVFGDMPEAQGLAHQLADALSASKTQAGIEMRQGRIDFIGRMGEPIQYIGTGFSGLDRWLYVDQGDYVVLGGRPSAGKTAFALNVAAHMAKTKRVSFYSLETSAAKIFDRMMTSIFDLDFEAVKRHQICDADMRRIITEAQRADALQFRMVPAAGQTVAWIQSDAIRNRADVVFVDYLGIVKSEGNGRYEKVTQISVDLHMMAQRTGIAVVALCQLNRGDKEEKKPTMTSLRESGQIEQDADAILFVYQDGRPDRRRISIAKNKEGVVGSKELAFDGKRQIFYEIEVMQDMETGKETVVKGF